MLLLLQEFVLSSINFSVFVSIYIYIMVVILLPLQMKPLRILLASSLFGLAVDFYSGTGALTAIVMTWIGFMRPYVAKLTLPSDIIVAGGIPYARRIGTRSFFKYTFVMSFLFVSLYSFLEIMSLENFGFTAIRVAASTVATTLLIYILQLPLKPR